MLDLIFRLALTAALGYAAYVDWRTMRVPFPLMWSLLIAGVAVAAFDRQWGVLIVAVMAAVISSLTFVENSIRAGAASAMVMGTMYLLFNPSTLTTGFGVPMDQLTVATVFTICFVWLLFEFNVIGGADATIAIGLLAMFHSKAFVSLLAATVLVGSLLMLIARHRLGAGLVLLRAVADVVVFVVLLPIKGLIGILYVPVSIIRPGAEWMLVGWLSDLCDLWEKPPTAADLEKNGQPAVWKIALAGVLFAWMPTFLRL